MSFCVVEGLEYRHVYSSRVECYLGLKNRHDGVYRWINLTITRNKWAGKQSIESQSRMPAEAEQ